MAARTTLLILAFINFCATSCYGQTATIFDYFTEQRVPPATTFTEVANGSSYSQNDVLQARWRVTLVPGANPPHTYTAKMHMHDSYFTDEVEDEDYTIAGGSVTVEYKISITAGDPATTEEYYSSISMYNESDTELDHDDSPWWDHDI